MDFLISDALAQGQGGAAPGGTLTSLIFPVALIVIFYFLLIRPQQKRAKEHKKLVEGLAKGDEIVSSGGLAGKVTDVGENFASVEIAPNVEIRLQKSAVAQVLPKGTLKQKLEKADSGQDKSGKKAGKSDEQ
ncbi:preprotein translocase subunit YajC [Arhodomonas aquaeolei]|uniref:preprotein translocase subunit YajC n=2 Tax=Ectothiorhodospiraceae TaxID=72276 RepID=UPI00035F80D8|nr:preprotein translocase subunit YajC [Arhodomonas aquaeolei]MCS4503839.1 preprotein translocase subunit YajC [Arhodomonas aquaeolei]